MVRGCGLLWTVFSGEGLWLTVDIFVWCSRDCGLLWTVFSGDRGTVAYCGQFLVVRDCVPEKLVLKV